MKTVSIAGDIALLAFLASATVFADNYRAPRLEHGRPDFQGMWANTNATPLERMPGVETLVISQEQADALDGARMSKNEDRTRPTEPTEFYEDRRIERIGGTFRSSIIIEPKDGKLPGTALFNQTMAKIGPAVLSGMDGPEQRPTSERCIGSLGIQPPMLSTPAANVHQIVQTKDIIVFASEEDHEARIIRLNAKHRPAAITSWDGDSIGWWEGDTLVIETTNFTPHDSARGNGQSVMLVSPQTKVIERFTRVSADELHYLFTVEDPTLYTQRWTGKTHYLRTNARMLEYACHEGNYSLTNVLLGARVREAQATTNEIAKQ
jgi:hypothetical protein